MEHVIKASEDDDEHVECDFCGADIFQSFFECKDCIPGTRIPENSSPEGGLVLCPSCFVEGRTCRCNVMKPMQYRPFEELLRGRNEAVKVIRDFDTHSTDNSYILWDEKYLRDLVLRELVPMLILI